MGRRRKPQFYLFGILAFLVLGIILCWWKLASQAEEKRLCINEVMFSSFWPKVEDKEYAEEWIELYNGTDEPVNLKGYGLSDNPDEVLKWVFPDISIEAGDHLMVYTAVYQGEGLKTNFNFGNKKEDVLLSSPSGEVLDALLDVGAKDDFSVGRFPDGGKAAILRRVSPGRSNNGSYVSRYLTESPKFGEISFSQEGGFFENEFELTLSTEDNAVIVYTLDGSDPKLTSKKYKKPIQIKNRSSEENLYAGKMETSDLETGISQISDAPVTKGTVVRARLVKNGILDSKIYTETYFTGIKESLTTISLVADPDSLFGYANGIYARGKVYDLSMRTKLNQDGHYNYLGNYSLKGEVAEKEGFLEIFSPEGEQLIDQGVGIRIAAGLHKRRSPGKVFRLYASKKYDEKTDFKTSFWSQSERGAERVKQLLLRTNAEFVDNVFTDVFVSTLFLNRGMGVQAYEPAVLYLNGEYWGLVAIRERVDERFVSRHFDLDKENIAMVVSDAAEKMVIETGSQEDLDDYLDLFDFVQQNDMSRDENYRYIEERMDIDSFIKSCWAHIFFAARDWPDNNVRAFRSKEITNSWAGDGKWRFLLYDMDYTCTNYAHNTLRYAMGDGEKDYSEWGKDSEQKAEWAFELFSGLMENHTFREEFLKKYQEYRKDVFDPTFLTDRLDDMLGVYRPYFTKTEERWELVRADWFLSLVNVLPDSLVERLNLVENWKLDTEETLKKVYEFVEKRRDYMDGFVKEYYEFMGEKVELG